MEAIKRSEIVRVVLGEGGGKKEQKKYRVFVSETILCCTVDTHHYAVTAAAKSLQLRLTLCKPIDGSPPGSAIPGILQARTLEWVAISFSNA